MKFATALLLTVLFIPLASAQTRPDCEGDGLKGHVRTVRITTAELTQKDGQPFEKMRPHEFVNEYDKKGMKTEERKYVGGVLREKTTFIRDNERSRTTFRYGGDGKLMLKSVQNYDAQGRPSTGANYDAEDVLQSRSVYTYDTDGKFLEAAIFDADGSLVNKTIFKHDEAGKQTGFEVYDASGKLLQKQVQTEGEIASTVYGQSEGDSHKWVTKPREASEYDSHGNWIKRSVPRVIKRGSEAVEGVEILYREITYY